MDAVVTTAGHRYEIAFDRTARTLVFVMGAVVDDADGQIVAPPYRVGVDEPLLYASDHDAGYALAGDAEAVLTDTTVAHPLTIDLDCDGYRPAVLNLVVPVNPVFPIRAPIALRRAPLRLTGRIAALATGLPVAGARLSITGPALPAPQRAVLLAQPLGADLTPAATLQGHAVVAVASPVAIKTATVLAQAGADEIGIDDRQNLAAGQMVLLGPPEAPHWAEIAAVSTTPANPALPGTVRLTAPLARSLRLGDAVAPFTLGAPVGPACTLIGAAFAGEAVVILNNFPSGDVVAISDALSVTRYAAFGIVSGPLGDYAIDGLARLASPVLTVAAAGFATQNRPFPLPRSQVAATFDWRLTP
jgi:hypothetical protein